MRRLMFVTAAFVLSGAAAPAQDRKPAEPPAPKVAAPAQPAQPNPFTRSAATRIAALEEEVETLEAHRDVKKGHVKASELGVRVAELVVERLTALAARGVVPRDEMEKAKIELEMAKVQVEIRIAEMKEVDVKIKHAKKRLEEAKVPAVRPAVPGRGDLKPADPADDKFADDLRERLATATIEQAKRIVEVGEAEANVKAAQERLAALRTAARAGAAKAEAVEAAEAKVDEAKTRLDRLLHARKVLEQDVEELRKRLKAVTGR